MITQEISKLVQKINLNQSLIVSLVPRCVCSCPGPGPPVVTTLASCKVNTQQLESAG